MAPDSEPTPRIPWLPVNEGAQAPQPPLPQLLTPTKPPIPSWIQREADPEPIEEASADVTPAVEPPSSDEVLPRPGEAAVQAADETPAPWNSDPVKLLGQSAVASAALSAAGAPTPLGGVPTIPADDAVKAPSFGDDAPLFIPRFEEPDPFPEPSSMAKADALAAGIVAQETALLATRSADLDGGAAYEPQSFGDATSQLPPQGAPPSAPKKRRWWPWVLVLVLLVAAVAAGLAYLNRPDAAEVPGTTVTEPPPGPTITPIAAPTATTFQAAMPTAVGTFSLQEATPLDPADIALTAGRVADGVDLTYRSGDGTMTVRALQYYNEDDATTMFTSFAGADTATQPVEAGGTTVGESAIITAPKPGMVWRNGTSVFILTGPAPQIADFYAQFGL